MVAEVGLCASCRQARRIVSGRGSVFWLCERSRSDASYARYPALPVLACRGHDPGGQPEADGDPPATPGPSRRGPSG